MSSTRLRPSSLQLQTASSAPLSAQPTDDLNALMRENARLNAQLRRMQDVLTAMREEIADANAETAALNRLHAEQTSLLHAELQRERSLRERLQQTLTERANRKMVSVATNTWCDMGTSTQSDASTTTVGTGTGFGVMTDLPYARPSRSDDYPSPPGRAGRHSIGVGGSAGGYATASSATGTGGGGGYQRGAGMTAYASMPPPSTATWAPPPQQYNPPQSAQSMLLPAPSGNYEILQFADWITRKSGYKPSMPSRDLAVLFDQLMGASSVGELCATITERDLSEFGVPLSKARTIMHYIMEHTAFLLSLTSGSSGPTSGY